MYVKLLLKSLEQLLHKIKANRRREIINIAYVNVGIASWRLEKITAWVVSRIFIIIFGLQKVCSSVLVK